MNNALYATIGMRLAELRKLRGVSVEDLAQALRTTAEEIRRYEAGAKIPVSCLHDISKALRITITALFCQPTLTKKRTSATSPSPQEGIDLVNTFVRIPDRRLRAMLLEIADYLADGSDP